jgi:hypothetical protein
MKGFRVPLERRVPSKIGANRQASAMPAAAAMLSMEDFRI